MKVDELLGPPVNFTLPLAARIRGQGGAPAHLARKRRIEDLIDAALAQLRAMAEAGRAALEAEARALDLERLNGLIVKHNRYFPIEANLPIDPDTGGSLGWQPLEPITVEWLLARL